MSLAVTTDGLCPAGKATLDAHDQRLDQHDQRFDKTEGKLDRITWLLVGTLATVAVNFGYMLLNGR